MEITLFLDRFDWCKLDVVKLVRTNLSDAQLNELLNFSVNSSVTTLVLSGNCLTEKALDALLNFTHVNTTLRNVYFSKNNMNCLKGQTRSKIHFLKEAGLIIYVWSYRIIFTYHSYHFFLLRLLAFSGCSLSSSTEGWGLDTKSYVKRQKPDLTH